MALLTSAPARAAGETWQASSVEGAVLVLIDRQWREIGPGDTVRDGLPVRTLQTGSVELRHGGIVIRLGAKTAVKLDVTGPSRAVLVQYAGTVNASIPDRVGLVMKAGDLTARADAGRVTMRMESGAASISVEAGRARVSGRRGHSVMLTANQTASVGEPGPAAVKAGKSGKAAKAVPATPAEPTPGLGEPATPAIPASPPAAGEGRDAAGPANGHGNGEGNGRGNGGGNESGENGSGDGNGDGNGG